MSRADRLFWLSAASLLLLATRVLYTWTHRTGPFLVGAVAVGFCLGLCLIWARHPRAELWLGRLGELPGLRWVLFGLGLVLALLAASPQLRLLTIVGFPFLLGVPWWVLDDEQSPRRRLSHPGLWIAIGIGLRVGYLLLCGEDRGDGAGRSLIAWDWARDPHVITPDRMLWGPGHFYLVGTAQWLTGEAYWTARVLTLAFGVASLPLMHRLTSRIAGERAALWATALLALYPLHVRYSTLTLAEVPFLFFVLLGSLGLVRAFEERPPLPALLGAGLALTAACSLRYEGWVIVLAFAVLSVRRPSELAELLRLASPRSVPLGSCFLIAVAFPLAWMLSCGLLLGDPLASAGLTRDHVREFTRPLPASMALTHWWEAGWRTLGPGALLALVGAWRLRDERARLFAGTALVLFLLFSAKLFDHSMTPQERHGMSLAVLLLPLAGAGLAWFESAWPLPWRRLGLALVLVWAATTTTAHLTRHARSLGSDERALAAWLPSQLAPGTHALMDQDDYVAANVTLRAGLSRGEVREVLPRSEARRAYSPSVDLARPGLAVVIVHARGRLPGTLGPRWTEAARFGPYTAYRRSGFK